MDLQRRCVKEVGRLCCHFLVGTLGCTKWRERYQTFITLCFLIMDTM